MTAQAQAADEGLESRGSDMVERLDGSSSGEYLDAYDSGDEPDVVPGRGAGARTGTATAPAGPPPPRPVQDLRSVSWRVSGVVADALRMEGNSAL